jgi:signal transduction histidine kinase
MLEAFVEPLFKRRTYTRLLYLLLLAFPLGILYFVILVTGISLGISLLVIWIGVPILLGMAIAVRAAARLERFFAVELLGAEIDPPTPLIPTDSSMLGRMRGLFRDPHTWSSTLWLFVLFPLGILDFVVLVTLVAVGLSALATPFIVLFTPVPIVLWSGLIEIDTLVGTIPLVLIGMAVLLLTAQVVNGLAWIHMRGAELLLGPSRRERLHELEQRTAVLEERTELGREMHDSIGHTITVNTLQAGAARQVFDDDPEFARGVLGDIEESGRRALDELDQTLRVLRDNGKAERRPAPGLDQLEGLVADSRAAGLPLQLRMSGDTATIPLDMGRSIYRILQEGLTNVMRHAGPVETTVTLAVEAGQVRLAVENAAPGQKPELAERTGRAGRGLVGIRERVAIFDGELEYGPTADAGYRLAVTIPSGARAVR